LETGIEKGGRRGRKVIIEGVNIYGGRKRGGVEITGDVRAEKNFYRRREKDGREKSGLSKFPDGGRLRQNQPSSQE